MLFNSIEFLLFLPIVFLLYWFVFNKKLSWQNGFLLVAGYFFYGWWSWKFVSLLVLSTVLDYVFGFLVASSNRKKAKLFLYLSLINNLGILGVFKYYNFFVIQFQKGFDLLGLHTNPLILQLVLPIGISFYTFHGLSYIFDIYRGHQKPVKSLLDYAVFVSFFPLLVAGPIERAGHLLPQVQKPRFFNYTQSAEGCRLILWGMFKKVVIADTLAGMVDDVFANYQNQHGLTLILGAVAFSFQIYGDFSGYSDMALGTSKLLGFEILSNFKFPYFSRDIAEFWRRWHVSLTSWFRDYLYIPLGGSKNGSIKTIRNIFIIFLLSAFWHGASWNFIAWGFIHACGFLPLLLGHRNRKYVSDVVANNRHFPTIKELWQMLSTFVFISFAWIFFRADGLQMALAFIKQIGISLIEEPEHFFILKSNKSVFIYLIALVIGDWYLRRDERVLRTPKNKIIKWLFYWLLLTLVAIYFDTVNYKFIYFQF